LDLYKNDNTQVSEPELQENSQPEKTTLGGQNKVTTDSKYVGGGHGYWTGREQRGCAYRLHGQL